MKTTASITPDQIFRALADPSRLRILNLLRGGELCVCYIVDALNMPQPKISRHLAYLRKVGLVLARREGLWIHYRLASPSNAFHQKLLDCLDSYFSESPALLKETKRVDRTRCC
jgi:ArsR family transcriptional regulator